MNAGLVRRAQNWIGGSDHSPRNASYVPPPPDTVDRCLDDLVAFVNRDDLPALMQAALAHGQFESIHPFVDGNGRIGRALVNLVLRRRGATTRVVVPLASSLVAHRERYFAALASYRRGDAHLLLSSFAAATLVEALPAWPLLTSDDAEGMTAGPKVGPDAGRGCVGASRQDGGVRSPTRTLAASTLVFEALVVFFAGLVAMQLSSLSRGTALALAGGLALACLVTAGLLRHPAGYVVGSVLQVAVVGAGFWVPAMFFLGGVFAVLWFVSLYLGRRLETEAAEREAAEAGR